MVTGRAGGLASRNKGDSNRGVGPVPISRGLGVASGNERHGVCMLAMGPRGPWGRQRRARRSLRRPGGACVPPPCSRHHPMHAATQGVGCRGISTQNWGLSRARHWGYGGGGRKRVLRVLSPLAICTVHARPSGSTPRPCPAWHVLHRSCKNTRTHSASTPVLHAGVPPLKAHVHRWCWLQCGVAWCAARAAGSTVRGPASRAGRRDVEAGAGRAEGYA